MLVKFVGNNFSQQLLSIGFSPKSKINLTPGREYEVFSISSWPEDNYYCVILDVGIPSWIPSTVFETVDDRLPEDWIRTELEGELKLLFGPEELVKDEASYNSLVNLEPDAVTRFWQYVEGDRLSRYFDASCSQAKT